jgi:hypothetical protein
MRGQVFSFPQGLTMSIAPAWLQCLAFFGMALVIEPSPGQLSGDAGRLQCLAFFWVPADAASRLGGCLTALRQFQEAETLLLSSYLTLGSAPATPPPRRVDALERIVKLYETWGKPDKAAAWRAKRSGLTKPTEQGAQPRNKDK